MGEWIGQGPGSKLLVFGPLYGASSRSWDELVRCLGVLKVECPSGYSHLCARFFGGVEVRRQVRFTRGGAPRGLGASEEIRVRGPAEGRSRLVLACVVYQWPEWVKQVEVEEALDFLEGRFRGEPFLPRELLPSG